MQQAGDLKTIQRLLYVALGLLLAAEALWLAKSVLGYVLVALFAVAMFVVHWLTRNNPKASRWRKFLALAAPVLTITGPVIYLLYILLSGSPSFWLHVALFAGFVLPLALLMLAIYRLQKLLGPAA